MMPDDPNMDGVEIVIEPNGCGRMCTLNSGGLPHGAPAIGGTNGSSVGLLSHAGASGSPSVVPCGNVALNAAGNAYEASPEDETDRTRTAKLLIRKCSQHPPTPTRNPGLSPLY